MAAQQCQPAGRRFWHGGEARTKPAGKQTLPVFDCGLSDQSKLLGLIGQLVAELGVRDADERERALTRRLAHELRDALLDECADVIQAACNLAASLGVRDMTDRMHACKLRNERRGRM